jgi:hypothetical protein
VALGDSGAEDIRFRTSNGIFRSKPDMQPIGGIPWAPARSSNPQAVISRRVNSAAWSFTKSYMLVGRLARELEQVVRHAVVASLPVQIGHYREVIEEVTSLATWRNTVQALALRARIVRRRRPEQGSRCAPPGGQEDGRQVAPPVRRASPGRVARRATFGHTPHDRRCPDRGLDRPHAREHTAGCPALELARHGAPERPVDLSSATLRGGDEFATKKAMHRTPRDNRPFRLNAGRKGYDKIGSNTRNCRTRVALVGWDCPATGR